jgi:hypothetical protein
VAAIRETVGYPALYGEVLTYLRERIKEQLSSTYGRK